MGRHQTENRDRQVVDRFRSVVVQKQQYKKRRRIRRAAVAVAALAIVASAGVLFNPQNESETVSENQFSERRLLHKTFVSIQSSPEKRPLAENSAAGSSADKTGKAQSVSIPDKLAVGDVTPKDTEPSMNEPAEAPEFQETSSPQAGKDVGKTAKTASDVIPGVRIAELVACRGVENHQYVGPGSEFSLETDNRPDVWVWMDVHSEKRKLPFTLKHVYSVDGSRYAAVMLDIAYPRTRTWSNVTLHGQKHIGRWRVDVVTAQGDILSSIEFTIIP